MRHFYIQGDAHTPQRFWRVIELKTRQELYDIQRAVDKEPRNYPGYIDSVEDDQVGKRLLFKQHGIV